MSCKRTLRQAGSYLFYSVLTTLVNWLAYSGCMRLLQSIDVSHQTGMVFLANTLSWLAAVTFAFFVNKLRVFRSRSWRSASARQTSVSPDTSIRKTARQTAPFPARRISMKQWKSP